MRAKLLMRFKKFPDKFASCSGVLSNLVSFPITHKGLRCRKKAVGWCDKSLLKKLKVNYWEEKQNKRTCELILFIM